MGDFKHTNLSAVTIEALRNRLTANGLLVRRGQQTLRAEVTSPNGQDLLALLDVMLQTIEQGD